MLTAKYHSGNSTCCHTTIDYQNHWDLKHLCKLGGAVTPLWIHTIEKASIALHQGTMGLVSMD